MLQVKLTKIGNVVGISHPIELPIQLKVGSGDSLFDVQMQIAEKVLIKYRDAFSALASCKLFPKTEN